MPSKWQEPGFQSNPIKPCSACGRPPAGSVQVGGVATLFWFECKTCGRKTDIERSFEEARHAWNLLQVSGSDN